MRNKLQLLTNSGVLAVIKEKDLKSHDKYCKNFDLLKDVTDKMHGLNSHFSPPLKKSYVVRLLKGHTKCAA